jgi:hypothetical protein
MDIEEMQKRQEGRRREDQRVWVRNGRRKEGQRARDAVSVDDKPGYLPRVPHVLNVTAH